jgi:hypothetical protein
VSAVGAGRRACAAAGALAVVALALRLPLMGDALFGDEMFTFELVDRDSLRRALGLASDTEGTPPLFYALAWAAHFVGDPAVSIRLPSLVFGVATVPVAFFLGMRVAGGVAAGMLAGALVAVNPFHVYYSTEARAYALAIFFVALALLALVGARRGERRWWVVLALAVAGALYSHYTAVLPVGGALAWAFFARPKVRRELALAVGAALVAWAPWVPFVGGHGAQESIAALSDFTLESVSSDLVRVVAGHPYRPIGALPGTAALIVLGAALVVAAVVCARAAPAPLRASLGRIARGPAGALVAAAVAAPAGVALYSLVGDDIFLPRNIAVSLVPACAAVAALIAAAARAAAGESPRRPALAATVVVPVLAVACLATAAGYGDDSRRVAWNRAAESVDSFTGPRTPVVDVVLLPVGDFLGRDPQIRSLEIHLGVPREVREARNTPASIVAAARGAPRVAVVIPGLPDFPPVPPPRLRGYRLTDQVIHPGLAPISVFAYARP